MKILITGITGYIGSHLAHYLSTDNTYSVYGIFRTEITDPDIRFLLSSATLFSLHEQSVLDIVKLVTPDMVIHLASCCLTQHQYPDIDTLINSNIIFPTKLLEAMNVVGVKKIINVGTSWQYYHSELFHPVNLYAATKQAFEDILKYYVKTENFSVINIILFDTYGRIDKRNKLIPLLNKAAKSKTLLNLSPGDQLIDLVHIDDVCEAFRLALHELGRIPAGKIQRYSVTNKERITLKQLVKIYEEVNNVKLNTQFGAKKYRKREVMTPCSHIPPVPGWQTKFDLRTGIKMPLN